MHKGSLLPKKSRTEGSEKLPFPKPMHQKQDLLERFCQPVPLLRPSVSLNLIALASAIRSQHACVFLRSQSFDAVNTVYDSPVTGLGNYTTLGLGIQSDLVSLRQL